MGETKRTMAFPFYSLGLKQETESRGNTTDDKARRGEDKRGAAAGILIKAATGGAGPLPAIAAGALRQALSVVSVTFNTGKTNDSSVLLKFTTQIIIPLSAEGAVSTATLSFGVERSRNNDAPVNIGPTFTCTKTAASSGAESFEFQLFDKCLESGSYTYTALLTNTSATVAGAMLINSTLSALAL